MQINARLCLAGAGPAQNNRCAATLLCKNTQECTTFGVDANY